jgi:hypothetical protein
VCVFVCVCVDREIDTCPNKGINSFVILGDIRQIAKGDSQLRQVCHSASNNSTPTGWILMKFDI